GVITDPRELAKRLDLAHPDLGLPEHASVNTRMLVAPLDVEEAAGIELVRGENISALPEFAPLPDAITGPVLLKMGDDVSTDEISPAGAAALPFRSNVPALADFTFTRIDESYPRRARDLPAGSGHLVVAGENYGQGSSREHAAITPRYLGLRVVIAKSFARIHWQNLANFGVLALEFVDADGYDDIDSGDELSLSDLRDTLTAGTELTARNATKGTDYRLRHRLSSRQLEAVLAGGIIPKLAHTDAAQ
ncbi:MAG: aconitate hydratase, partial [Sciscionella sp.]